MKDTEMNQHQKDGSCAINSLLWEQLPGSQVKISLFLDFFGSYFWNVVGSEQAMRIKKEYYKALLDQEIGWYDKNDPNKIVTKVTTNITHIETATG